jgi:hypothetical protein
MRSVILQNDQNDFNPMIPIILQTQRGRDLTFITNHNNFYGEQQYNPMSSLRDAQMLEMNQCLMQANMMLLEQRKINAVLLEASLKQIGDGRQVNNLQIESKEEETDGRIKRIGVDVVDAEYVVEDSSETKPINSNKEKEKMVGENTNSKDTPALNKIWDSIGKQLKNDNAPPYYLEGNITGTVPGKVVFAPIIFTVRNPIWRDRVRYIMREVYYNKNTRTFRRKENQENNLSVIVVLYNSKVEPVEIVVISRIELRDFMRSSANTSSISANGANTAISLNKLVFSMSKTFKISLSHYFHTEEPILDDNTPKVLSREGNTEYMADIVRVKPVFSFSKKEQCYSISTYNTSIFRKSIFEIDNIC